MGNIDNINAVQTPKGWMLRIKQGTQWLNAILHGDIINDKNVFIPQVWYFTGQLNASPSSYPHDEKYYLPNYINHSKIIGIMFGITTSSQSFDVWNMGGEESGTTGYMSATSSGGSSLEKTKACRVRYNIGGNYVEIKIPHNEATAIPGARFKLAVFFK